MITCRCVLPQFKRTKDAPLHQFVVFSTEDDEGNFCVRFAQCNNCGIVHKVIDYCRSEICAKEAMASIPTIDDIKLALSPRLAEILDANNVDLATWEKAKFIIENKRWGDFVVLASDVDDDLRQGKYVQILGENLFTVSTYTQEQVIK